MLISLNSGPPSPSKRLFLPAEEWWAADGFSRDLFTEHGLMEDEEGSQMEEARFRCEVTTTFESCVSGTTTFLILGVRLGLSTLLGSSTTAFFGMVY